MKKESRRLKVGVLGAGPISQSAHFDACRKARNADLYAICDAAQDLTTRMTEIHQPRVSYFDYDAMLADPRVEAVLIGVADQFHVALAGKAIAAGKHVLVEKPLGTSIEECEALLVQARSTDLVVQVANNRRFDPGIVFAHRFVREELGRLLAMRAWYYDSVYRYTMTDNLQPIPLASAQAKRPEGDPKADKARYFMLTHGSHLVDTARFLGGEIDRVQARFSSGGDSFCWFVAIDFSSGCVGHLDLIVPVRGDFEEGFRVFGEGGSVTGRVHLPWFHKSSVVECFSAADRQYHRPLGEDAYTYKLQIESFADTILHGVPQLGATIEDGVAAMRAMVAISRSVETGAMVRLSDATGGV